MKQRFLTTTALVATLVGGVFTAGAAVTQASAWEPKPFHATGDVRKVDAGDMRLEMQSKTAPRHFRIYTLAPGLTVQSPRGPETLNDIAPKMRVRLMGVRAPGNTWMVNQVVILPQGVRHPFPKPFQATGEVRSVNAGDQELEMKSRTAPRHFRVYALQPDVAVVSAQGPARLSDVTPKSRVRLTGEREADNTWTVEQIQVLSK
jgi:hypothetical protein